MFKKIAVAGVGVYMFIGFAFGATAPKLFFEVSSQPVSVGSQFLATLTVDSDDAINAYEIEFGYPTQILRVVGFDDSNSVITVWQKPPGDEHGLIKFAGASFAPFAGRRGKLLAIRFEAIRAGQAELNFISARVYRADGAGTRVSPETQNAIFAISSGGEAARSVAVEDNTPPEIASLSLVPDPFDRGKKILSFSVSDAGSGVKEIMARSKRFLRWSDWQKITNPVALLGDMWAVNFKVLDNNDNANEAVLYDWAVFFKLLAWFFVPIVIALAAFFLVARIRKMRGGG